MGLSLFVVIALAVYTGMHLVVYWGVHPLLASHPLAAAAVGAWMVAMIAAPVLVRVLARGGHEAAARVLGWVGYGWLGFLFLAFSLFAVLGAWEVLVWAATKAFPALGRLAVHGPGTTTALVLAVLATGIYGFFEARHLLIETVALAVPTLGAGRDRLRVVQVSDLHLGLLHREGTLAEVVSRVRELAPDLLLATGDVVDAQLDHLDGLSDLWRAVDPPLGKFAVVGNHEVYAGLGPSLEFLHRSGFTVLRNRAAEAGDALRLVGVDDPHAPGPPPDESALLPAGPRDRFTVLLKHRPVVSPAAAGRFDLQLSGHTHLGQIFPFRLLTGLQYPMQNGLYVLPGGSHLYTSRGTGTWGPPMRVLAPPEITVFDLRRSPAAP